MFSGLNFAAHNVQTAAKAQADMAAIQVESMGARAAMLDDEFERAKKSPLAMARFERENGSFITALLKVSSS